MTEKEFRETGYKFIDLAADYLYNTENYKVLPDTKPGDVKKSLPVGPPETGEDFTAIIKDVQDLIFPNLTHWNHPGFMAYFNSTSSGPGIMAELLSATLNINGMLWKTGPASVELEERMLEWHRELTGLPKDYWGIVYDTASVSTMHALAAAREQAGLNIRENGFDGKKLRLYISEHTHSSVEKGAVTLGIGLNNIVKIPADKNFRMIPEKLEAAISEDMAKGYIPFCVVATIGTTSTTSIDPVEDIGAISEKYSLWLHVDAAFAGTASLLPEKRELFAGWDKADSIVINPHKWMFTPVDLSILYTRKKDTLKKAFSLVAEYLKTGHDSEVENYMDYGIQLGRRFRSLKLWFIFRYYGAEKIREILRGHFDMAEDFYKWVENEKELEIMAPRPFSVICFRAVPVGITDEQKLNSFNETLLEKINESGRIFLSHTKLNGKFVIRLAISGIRTEKRHVEEARKIIKDCLASAG